jgi:polysaccharide pyruvyl transferase WcaK-like protein
MNEFKRLYPQAKTIIFGTGVGDIDMWNQFGVSTDVSGWVDALERADYVSVRGALSKQHLEKWGVTRHVEVVGDPAVWFARDQIAPKRHEKRIGLNLGFTKGLLHGQDDNVVLALGASLLKRLKADNWQITLFPVIASDIPFLHEAVTKAGIETPPMHMDYLNVRGTLDALEQQDVFIGEKLHSVVLAHCVYTPAVMLEYRTKCRDYMLSVNQSDCSFRTDALDADLIHDKICALYANTAQHQSHLYTQLQQLKANLHRAAQDVITILNR